MERLPETQAILRMFPWGRLESDGTFNFDIARARLDVLGSSGYGYWSHRGGSAPHANVGPMGLGADPTFGGLLKLDNFIDGNDLLKKKHLTDEQGWKLPSRLIPYLDFTHSSAKQPVIVTELPERIRDWKSWYAWRGLPLESPAALLMAAPLSVYQLLVRCLEVTKPSAGSADKRVSLIVHLLGVEVELNHVPLFAELVLLLPYHDIKLVFFGGAVKAVVDAARKKPGALAAQDPVYTYRAPDALGAGALSVHFHGETKEWTPEGEVPDAVVACNAGLGSYPEWIPVVRATHWAGIPFAVTEYAEQSAEHQRSLFPAYLAGGCEPREDYPIALNPFQQPGQRMVGVVRLPNAYNGFTLTVVKK
ncbi:uncharacterized protein C8Q71DRAFT_744582 [Rhodofomes roseus]|uniref:Mitochondrial splicing suppressor 51-like C-terminal domain-containing protein n=1 Tax=Rhodofomes roseus TaxID=34475 RepID=A0ABQ8KNH6_9APHY|nr:uncharacterized protein C8Q71DRAFT_744582 [Rhodofomes roseus]KAH9839866.1 hypothetical protein C8Q71DRAFT_744582 [Rhodofomes roseus]